MLHIISLVEQGQSHLVPWTGGNPLQTAPHQSRPAPADGRPADQTAAAASTSEGPRKKRRTQAPDAFPEATPFAILRAQIITSISFFQPLLGTRSPWQLKPYSYCKAGPRRYGVSWTSKTSKTQCHGTPQQQRSRCRRRGHEGNRPFGHQLEQRRGSRDQSLKAWRAGTRPTSPVQRVKTRRGDTQDDDERQTRRWTQRPRQRHEGDKHLSDGSNQPSQGGIVSLGTHRRRRLHALFDPSP